MYGYAPGNYYCRCCTCTRYFEGDKRSTNCEACARNAAALPIKKAVAQPPVIFAPTHRHLKTGGLYKVLYSGLIEKDLTTVIIYQGDDGIVWVRPFKEFIEKFESLR